MTKPQELTTELRKVRRAWNLTTPDVAELMGTSDSFVAKAESKAPAGMGVYTLCRWADALGCDVKIVLRGSATEKERKP